MKSIFSTPGKITQPTQPAIQQAPTMAPTQNMGTPNTPRAPTMPQNWQRGVRGMDRVNTVPGGVQPLYRPPQPQGGMLGGMIQRELAKQQPSGYDQFKANMPPMEPQIDATQLGLPGVGMNGMPQQGAMQNPYQRELSRDYAGLANALMGQQRQ